MKKQSILNQIKTAFDRGLQTANIMRWGVMDDTATCHQFLLEERRTVASEARAGRVGKRSQIGLSKCPICGTLNARHRKSKTVKCRDCKHTWTRR